MKKVTETVRELALPVVEEQGCKLWDVEYVREAGQWYLRIYIMGSPVLLKTYKPVDGRKEFSGDLAGYEDGAVTLRIGEEERRFEKDTVALVRLRCDF